MASDLRHLPLLFKPHPWHGIPIGDDAPRTVTCFIEIVPTDTVKYELDKATGYLKVDRPQKFSNVCPTLYGFIPQTYCGEQVGAFCGERTGRQGIVGDGDPLDICVLTEKRHLARRHPPAGDPDRRPAHDRRQRGRRQDHRRARGRRGLRRLARHRQTPAGAGRAPAPLLPHLQAGPRTQHRRGSRSPMSTTATKPTT